MAANTAVVCVYLVMILLPQGTSIPPGAWLQPTQVAQKDVNITLVETLVEGTSSNTSTLFTTIQVNNDPTGYRVLSQKYDGMFYVEFDNELGRLYLNDTSALDYEQEQMIVIEVAGGNSEGSGTATLTITVEDANDNFPVFEYTVYRAEITSLAGVTEGSYVSTVTATDLDTGVNSDIAYAIAFGDRTCAESRFSIGAQTGNITTTGYDFEKSIYVLRVVATDNGSVPLTGTTTLSVCINNIYCGSAGTIFTRTYIKLVFMVWLCQIFIYINRLC